MKWVDIPAVRVLETDVLELIREFTLVTHDGIEIHFSMFQPEDQIVDFRRVGVHVYRMIRKADGKVFRWQQHWVMACESFTLYLDEV